MRAKRAGEKAMEQNSFHLMYMFAATCGVLFIPVILGLVAVFMERDSA